MRPTPASRARSDGPSHTRTNRASSSPIARHRRQRADNFGDGTRSMIILCADDYALTEGVSRAIGELAAAQRLSATSVLVTSAHWPASAPRLCVHRGHLSVGLHLDLTLGAPLGPMPRLAPAGTFPGAARPPRAIAARPSRRRRDQGRDRPSARPLRAGDERPARPHRRPPACARACRAFGRRCWRRCSGAIRAGRR